MWNLENPQLYVVFSARWPVYLTLEQPVCIPQL